jgi:two-component system sensor histidine kinase ChvG
MRRVSRITSRISLRLMLFNVLLVFLPVAGVLLLVTYEQTREHAEIEGMQRQIHVVAAAMRSGSADAALKNAAPLLRQWRASDGRLRVVDTNGRVVIDSGPLQVDDEIEGARNNWLYRVGAALLKKPFNLMRRLSRPLTSSNEYERSPVLRGAEVSKALLGMTAIEKRVSSGSNKQVMLYVAAPVFQRGNTIGAVVISRPTDEIRQDLHSIRLAVFEIFIVSLAFAIVLSMMIGTTIVRPLRQLRREASAILDRRGRLRGRFRGSRKRDEIGELSRALERLTRRVEHHQKATEAFASDVSHEFKNPLASIRMATEMLAQVDAPPERARFTRIAELEIARMEKLLSQVREITAINGEIQKEEQTNVDVRELLRQLVDGFCMRERDRVAFELSMPEEEPLEVRASADRLMQVFENLLDNAVSFAPMCHPERAQRVEGPPSIAEEIPRLALLARDDTSPEVFVSASGDDRSVFVRVRDHGPGIPEENLGRLFDRFFTYRPAEQRRHTGLGLSIVKTIVEAYGGTVSASNDPDGGALFEVRLPRARAA